MVSSGKRSSDPLTTPPAAHRCRPSVVGIAVLVLSLGVNAGVQAQVADVAAVTPSLLPVGFWQHTSPSTAVAAAANALTIRINSGANQTIGTVVDNSINPFPSPVNITTEWVLSTTAVVDLVAYFPSSTVALSSRSDRIPSSRVEGRMSSGRVTSFSAFTESGVGGIGIAGASLHLFRQFVSAGVNATATRTDNLELQIDLRGAPILATGTYRGTLALRAIAY